jgi:hypothetical protein
MDLVEAESHGNQITRLPDGIVQKISLPDQEPRITAKELDTWVKVLAELGVISDKIDATRLIVAAE